MPSSWSPKDERQYKHILHSYGSDSPRAKEIAARTVNAQRRSEGRTKLQHHLHSIIKRHKPNPPS